MLRISWLLLSFLISWSSSYGQQAESDNDSVFKTIQLPMFDLGIGWSFLIGDIGNTSPAPSPALQLSYGLSIRQAIMPYLSVSVDFSSGKFYGEKALGDSGNINYQTSAINQGLRFTYEASHLFSKNTNGFIQYQPYVGVGIGLISFRAKGDLKDGNLNTYNYWNDGTIRSLPEAPGNVDLAEVISRDMVYESDLRDANLDGFGRYNQMALRVPIEVGFRYQFTKRIGAHIKGVYNLNFTDLLDNVTAESLGDRRANPSNDNHVSALVGVSVYLGEYRKPKQKKKVREPKPALIAIDDANTLNDDKTASQDSTSILANNAEGINKEPSESEEESVESKLSDKSETSINKVDSLSDEIESLSQVKVIGGDLQESDSNKTNDEVDSGKINEDATSSQNSNASPAQVSVGDEHQALDKNKTVNNSSGSDIHELNSNEAAKSGSTENKKNITTNSNPTGVDDEYAASDKANESNSSTLIEDNSTSMANQGDSIESAENQPHKSNEIGIKKGEMTTLDLIDKTMDIESTEPKIAGSYHWADVNKDKYISADEVLHFIDLLFDGESKYTVPMIHQLIEYYFDQD